MKKALLSLAFGALVCTGAYAEGRTPQAIEDLILNKVSPDGTWTAGDDGNGQMVVINLSTGQDYYCVDPEGVKFYKVANGNAISNDGIVLGTQTLSDASYWKEGQWYPLPIKAEDTGDSSANGITPDSKRICGNIGKAGMSLDSPTVMIVPVIWQQNADGTYGDYIELPYPDKDMTGRLPQYVTAVVISDDGMTVAGQVVDNSGQYRQPIVFTEDDNGEWSYKLLGAGLFGPEDAVWPEDPGDAPAAPNEADYLTQEQLDEYVAAMEHYNNYQIEMPLPDQYISPEGMATYLAAMDEFILNPETGMPPMIEDFMTPEELQSYNAALDQYNANMPKFPLYSDYMDAEQLQAYQTALDQYNVAYGEWIVKQDAFQAAVQQYLGDAPAFDFNNLFMSGNAQYYATTSFRYDWDTMQEETVPYLFKIEDDSYVKKSEPVLLTFVNDEGQLLGASPANAQLRSAFITENAEAEFVPLYEYVQGKNTEVFDWMMDNMLHEYYELQINEETMLPEAVLMPETWLTGTPCATPNLSTIVSWQVNQWDLNPTAPYYYSYIIDMNYTSGISSPTHADMRINVDAAGAIHLNGEISELAIFDLTGKCLLKQSNPAAVITPALPTGIYLIKAIGSDGSMLVHKAQI